VQKYDYASYFSAVGYCVCMTMDVDGTRRLRKTYTGTVSLMM